MLMLFLRNSLKREKLILVTELKPQVEGENNLENSRQFVLFSLWFVIRTFQHTVFKKGPLKIH